MGDLSHGPWYTKNLGTGKKTYHWHVILPALGAVAAILSLLILVYQVFLQ